MNKHLFNVPLEQIMNLPSPIGLKLSNGNVQEIIDKLEFKRRPKETNFLRTISMANNKITHACFSATLLKIGAFKFESPNKVDLVANCDFAHKKFVWEMLIKNIKYKVEIMWQDISAIRLVDEENSQRILEIELIKEPTFYHKINVEQQIQSKWELSQDFTNGHATIYRRHYLEFPREVHFKKVLQSNEHLLELSQKRFPSLDTSFFGIPLFYGLIAPPSRIYSTPPISVNNPSFHNFMSAPNTYLSNEQWQKYCRHPI